MYILKKFVNALSLLNSYPENGIPLPETNRSGTSYYTNKLYKNFIVVLEAGLWTPENLCLLSIAIYYD